jgi:hypothetical protein
MLMRSGCLMSHSTAVLYCVMHHELSISPLLYWLGTVHVSPDSHMCTTRLRCLSDYIIQTPDKDHCRPIRTFGLSTPVWQVYRQHGNRIIPFRTAYVNTQVALIKKQNNERKSMDHVSEGILYECCGVEVPVQ